MNKILLLLAGIMLSCQIYAQYPGAGGGGNWGPKKATIKGKISGKLIDSSNDQPVEFATVMVSDATGKQVGGGLTNERGVFKILDIPTGKYNVEISFIGYETILLKDIELTPSSPDYDLKNLKFAPSSTQLSAVTVSGEAALYENKVDKIVYNAEKDITNAGSDATEVLRKVPLLTVDLDGNVSLRGSSNIQILLNGRPSGLFANSVADALKSIPSDQIKSVEVITSPSAKYDGEGSAGIINIITKKKSVDGISGSLNGSASNRSNNLSLNLAAAKGRFGLNGGGYGFYTIPREGSTSFLREEYLDNYTNRSGNEGTSENSVLGYSGNFGAFYDFNAFNSLNSSFRFNGFNRYNEGSEEGFIDQVNLMESYNRMYDSKNLRGGFDWNTDYIRKFKKPDHELVFAFQISESNSKNRDEAVGVDIEGNAPRYDFDSRNTNDGKNREYTFQSDYTHPMSSKFTLETGLKTVLRNIDSDYIYTNKEGGVYVEDEQLSDFFNYKQNVYAGYLSGTFTFSENLSMIAGARYEYTDIKGSYQSEKPSFANNYDNILPSVTISRKMKNFQTLKASYTERIQRPSLYYINPYAANTDPLQITLGNPDLEPEYTRQVELSYSAFIKGKVINFSVYYKNTSDVIEQIVQVDDENVAESSFYNVGSNNSIGFNAFSSLRFGQKFTVRGGFNIYTYNVDGNLGGEDYAVTSLLWNANLNGSWKFAKGFKAEAFGFFNSPKQTLQGTYPSFSLLSIAVRKDILKGKGGLGLRIQQPFMRDMEFRTEIEGENFYQTSQYTIPFRNIGLSFSYNFGKLKFDESKLKSKIRNTDVKDQGNQNF